MSKILCIFATLTKRKETFRKKKVKKDLDMSKILCIFATLTKRKETFRKK